MINNSASFFAHSDISYSLHVEGIPKCDTDINI